MNQELKDIQNENTHKKISLPYAGISELIYPILFEHQGTLHPSIGSFNISVALPAQQRGTHMSRFLELLESHREEQQVKLSLAQIKNFHAQLLKHSKADQGCFSVSFEYFLEKKAQVSLKTSLLPYKVCVSSQGTAQESTMTLELQVFVTTLCPCSKEISKYGAHNQRSLVTLKGVITETSNIAELIRLIEGQSSCEIFGLLKRVDEKFVTEKAYERPKFVEDMVRDIAYELHAQPTLIKKWSVESKHFESIHHHNAYAIIYHDS